MQNAFEDIFELAFIQNSILTSKFNFSNDWGLGIFVFGFKPLFIFAINIMIHSLLQHRRNCIKPIVAWDWSLYLPIKDFGKWRCSIKSFWNSVQIIAHLALLSWNLAFIKYLNIWWRWCFEFLSVHLVTYRLIFVQTWFFILDVYKCLHDDC